MTKRKLPRGVTVNDGHYWISYSLHGERQRRSLGPTTAISIADCVTARNIEIGKAILADEIPTRAKKPLTVSELLDRFEAAYASGTTRVNMTTYSKHLKVGLGSVSLDRLGIVQLVGYRRERLKQKIGNAKKLETVRTVTNATISRELSALRVCVNWARSQRLPIGKEGSVFDFLTKADRRVIFPRETNSAEPARISDDDLAAICSKLPVHARAIPLLAVRTGCRLMELVGLDWSEVDLVSVPATIRPRKTKSGKARTIPLAPSAVALLPVRPPTGGPVFVGPRDGKPLATFPLNWVTARNAAGLPGTKFHSLRHEFASRWCERGGDLRTLQAIGGWSSLDLVERYSRANLSRAVDVIEARQ